MTSQFVQISRLPWMVGVKELRTYCSVFGSIQNIYVPVDYSSGFTHGVAWVQFANDQSQTRFMEKAVHTIEGHIVTVKSSQMLE